jgi:hypothetical protein
MEEVIRTIIYFGLAFGFFFIGVCAGWQDSSKRKERK